MPCETCFNRGDDKKMTVMLFEIKYSRLLYKACCCRRHGENDTEISVVSNCTSIQGYKLYVI